MTDGTDMEIHYADEWAALYVDGKLNVVGSTYWVEETALDLLGVRKVSDDAFMRGQSRREGVAKDLQEVAEYASERSREEAEAKALEEEAERLVQRAAEIRASRS